MTTPAPHTPVNFLKAGGMGGFSAKCIQLLAECGYHPDDFGNHAYVQDRLKQARQKRKEYLEQCKQDGVRPSPNGPDPHTAFLARCQSGHLTQDALMRGKGSRGDCCANHSPPGSDTRGYHTDAAPCMPMATYGPTGQKSIGSDHWAVGRNESAQHAGTTPASSGLSSGSPVSSTQLGAMSQENTAIVTPNPPRSSHPTHDAALKSAKWDKNKQAQAAQRKGGIALRKQARSAALVEDAAAAEAGEAQGAAGDSAAFDGNTAAECIEAFRSAAMEKMQQDAVTNYGENYESARDEAQAAKAQADQALADAEAARPKADIEQARRDAVSSDPPDWDAYRAANAELGERRGLERNAARADQEVRNVDCLHAQARSLAGQPPPPPNESFTAPSPLNLPGFTGQIP
ncbi:MAG: hypothetical protein EVA89_00460 [Sandaracinaceae bacterium]|nr:MAG: hypothetical protein EVA89_00460 [Sandaracinaceae bacterium]